MKHDNRRGVSSASFNVPLGSLRTFLTLLVVAHHAVLAYHPYAPPAPASLLAEPRLWPAFPIVDSQRSPLVALFVGFNDTFFMSLMFLISGAFAWPSLVRKGSARFFRDRLARLGVPFLFAAGLLAPLAYYPSYLETGAPASPQLFLRQWLRLGDWPAGPAWFLWVLLALGGAAAAAHRWWPTWGTRIGALSGRLGRRPITWAAALVAASALAYVPLTSGVDPLSWAHLGPFWVQTSRVLHYAVYFVAGVGLGAWGLERDPLAPEGRLARRWWLWVLSALAAFVVAVGAVMTIVQTLAKGGPGPALAAFGNLTFVLSCAASSLACLAVFVRFARTPHRLSDHLGSNAYGIYLFHYPCVAWLQWSLLGSSVPPLVKGIVVFLGAVAISWSLSAALRRVPAVARIL